jgi:hypothetical protein
VRSCRSHLPNASDDHLLSPQELVEASIKVDLWAVLAKLFPHKVPPGTRVMGLSSLDRRVLQVGGRGKEQDTRELNRVPGAGPMTSQGGIRDRQQWCDPDWQCSAGLV